MKVVLQPLSDSVSSVTRLSIDKRVADGWMRMRERDESDLRLRDRGGNQLIEIPICTRKKIIRHESFLAACQIYKLLR